jgi:hypothetical protein
MNEKEEHGADGDESEPNDGRSRRANDCRGTPEKPCRERCDGWGCEGKECDGDDVSSKKVVSWVTGVLKGQSEADETGEKNGDGRNEVPASGS